MYQEVEDHDIVAIPSSVFIETLLFALIHCWLFLKVKEKYHSLSSCTNAAHACSDICWLNKKLMFNIKIVKIAKKTQT
jgi:hypothetical protein